MYAVGGRPPAAAGTSSPALPFALPPPHPALRGSAPPLARSPPLRPSPGRLALPPPVRPELPLFPSQRGGAPLRLRQSGPPPIFPELGASAGHRSQSQIFAPIVNSLQWSLVAVSTKQKKNFILDSGIIGGEQINRPQAITVLNNLKSHLSAISEFETVAPFVPTQDHEHDSGFHVLMYMEELVNGDGSSIYDIQSNTETVSHHTVRMSVRLLEHRLNQNSILPRLATPEMEVPEENTAAARGRGTTHGRGRGRGRRRGRRGEGLDQGTNTANLSGRGRGRGGRGRREVKGLDQGNVIEGRTRRGGGA